MDYEKLEVYLVGYNVPNIVVTSILILFLCLLCYAIFYKYKVYQIWKVSIVKLFVGGVAGLLVISSALLMHSSIRVYQHRESLKNGSEKVYLVKGVPSFERIPLSIRDVTGPRTSVATLDDVIFSVGRYPSDCINGRLVYKFNKVLKLDSEDVIFRGWYIKRAGKGYPKEFQDFSACLIKLEILRSK